MHTLSKEELEQWISQKEDILIINILPKEDFAKRSIPGSINIPFKNNPNFISEVEKRVQCKDKRLVLYCSSKECDVSKQAAKKLDNAGFSNIYDFEKGIEGWFAKDKTAA